MEEEGEDVPATSPSFFISCQGEKKGCEPFCFPFFFLQNMLHACFLGVFGGGCSSLPWGFFGRKAEDRRCAFPPEIKFAT